MRGNCRQRWSERICSLQCRLAVNVCRATSLRAGLADGAGHGARTDSTATAREATAVGKLLQSAGQLPSTVANCDEADVVSVEVVEVYSYLKHIPRNFKLWR